MTLVHVGDSRAYRLTRAVALASTADGRLDLLTRDHNVRSELLAAGLDVRDYRERGVALHGLTSFVGLEHDVLRIDVLAVPVRAGDRLLLCTDGVHRQVDDDQLRLALAAPSCRLAAEQLVADGRSGRRPRQRHGARRPARRQRRVGEPRLVTDLTATLRLAPGPGLLARKATALLYAPGRDASLIDAFSASARGAEAQALASTTVGAGFAVGPFVCLSWDAGIRVMAFGDVAVETDQPSLPMLSGAGSRTWVEHTLVPNGTAVVEVVGADAAIDTATDLAEGVALAGGFRLELADRAASREPAPAAASEPSQTADVTEAVPRPEAPEVVAAPTVRAPEPAPAPVLDPDDPAAALAAIQAAAVGPDGELLGSAGTRSTIARPPEPAWTSDEDAHDADVTLPPPASEVILADVRRGDAGDTRASLVEAKLCGNGHPNPPTGATCGVCGAFLAPGAAAIVHVPRPSLGRLELDDGELVELDQELLIGRNPDRDTDPTRAALRRVKALGDKVSRSHLEVRFQGWDVLVADCGNDQRYVRDAARGRSARRPRAGPATARRPRRGRVLRLTFVHRARSRRIVSRDTRLHVDFIGEVTTVELGDELTFGRLADLHIDDNRHLHRVLGRFWSRGDTWWLTNEGRSITIQIADADSRSNVMLAPGSEIALSFPNSILRFRAGITDYEVIVSVPDRDASEGDDEDDPLDVDADELGADTIALGDLLLTDEQRLLLLALGEGTLRDPHHNDELPTNRAVARRLGWSITKFNRKLDNLCNRFTKLGVGGLRGSIDQLATDRRRRLVDHAVESGLITRGQLALLPPELD